jgi:hypothetical protein
MFSRMSLLALVTGNFDSAREPFRRGVGVDHDIPKDNPDYEDGLLESRAKAQLVLEDESASTKHLEVIPKSICRSSHYLDV